MSEFTCFCGGMMISGKCERCSSLRVYEMDGMTARQIARMEESEEAEERDRDEENNEEDKL